MIDQIIQEISSSGYAYVSGLLRPAELAQINSFFLSERNQFQPAMVGTSANRQRLESVRGDYTLWVDPLDPPPAFEGPLSFLNELKQALNEQCYLGLKEFECHLAYYPPGTFYQKHTDRFESSSTRSLSFVFYLNENWGNDDGGELLLFNKENELVKTIQPLPGSFICFLSEQFPHEVKSAKIERRSLTGWMHTKIIY